LLTPGFGLVTPGIETPGIVTPDIGIVTPGIGMVTPGIGMVTPGIGIATPGIGMVTPGIGMVTPDIEPIPLLTPGFAEAETPSNKRKFDAVEDDESVKFRIPSAVGHLKFQLPALAAPVAKPPPERRRVAPVEGAPVAKPPPERRHVAPVEGAPVEDEDVYLKVQLPRPPAATLASKPATEKMVIHIKPSVSVTVKLPLTSSLVAEAAREKSRRLPPVEGAPCDM